MENWCRTIHVGNLMNHSVVVSLKGFVARSPLGNSLQFFAFQGLGIMWHICHASCFATRFRRGLCRGLISEEVVDGSEGLSSLLHQVR
mgnify:CR=1 FL=1